MLICLPAGGWYSSAARHALAIALQTLVVASHEHENLLKCILNSLSMQSACMSLALKLTNGFLRAHHLDKNILKKLACIGDCGVTG